MNRKRRSKICCLSGILLLILLLVGVQRVSAMTTRTELYQNTPSDGGRSGGKEKQFLANSYAGEYQKPCRKSLCNGSVRRNIDWKTVRKKAVSSVARPLDPQKQF